MNTTDGTAEYEAAFALVWQTDENYAMNVNEAHASASCDSCAAVAVAYQVVFVIDMDDTNDNVAVPQNLAGALNYECVNCLTYALARQLFVTLDQPLSAEAVDALEDLWADIAGYGAEIERGNVPLGEIRGQLEKYTNEIVAIVNADQPGTNTNNDGIADGPGHLITDRLGGTVRSAIGDHLTNTRGNLTTARGNSRTFIHDRPHSAE